MFDAALERTKTEYIQGLFGKTFSRVKQAAQ